MSRSERCPRCREVELELPSRPRELGLHVANLEVEADVALSSVFVKTSSRAPRNQMCMIAGGRRTHLTRAVWEGASTTSVVDEINKADQRGAKTALATPCRNVAASGYGTVEYLFGLRTCAATNCPRCIAWEVLDNYAGLLNLCQSAPSPRDTPDRHACHFLL
jgi:hypothetical protein